MTTSLMVLLTLILIFTCLISSENPVKVSMILVLLSSVIFYKGMISTEETWLSMMFLLLFAGGILVMFLMLTSLMPNEPMKGSGLAYFSIFIVISATFFQMGWAEDNLGYTKTSSSLMMKSTLMEGWNMFSITMLILAYFSSFSSLVLTKKTTLRMEACW